MNKQITSVFLVAGTCIGTGMIALPMSLAKLGSLEPFIPNTCSELKIDNNTW